MIKTDYKDLQRSIGYEFKDRLLLIQALTHSSYTNEHRIIENGDYERLEFIGDAILEMISSIRLYREFPEESEGNLSKMRASLVCEEALSKVALDKLNISGFLILGHGEEATGGRNKPSILCDVVESIIGAIYLDGGLAPATDFIENKILDRVSETRIIRDYKTSLQELIQSKGPSVIEYRILNVAGPDHKREFTAGVFIDDVEAGRGVGNSKKQAQQAAAKAALGLKE